MNLSMENFMARDSRITEKDFETKQRRKLVDQWASMSQADRDSYQGRAPDRADGACWYPYQLKNADPLQHIRRGFVNLIVQQPLDPRNRALWTKLCIMLYRLDAEDTDHSFGKDQVVLVHPNPANNTVITPENYYTHCFVEPADFDHMAMTLQGTVFFHSFDRGMLFADQESLETGRLLLCDLDNNGQVKTSSRMWPLWTYMVYCYVFGLGWYGSRVIDEYDYASGDDDANAALNMELPILELLQEKQEYFDNDVDVDYWTEAIEQYAPGYLEMEAEGNGGHHGLSRSFLRVITALIQMTEGDSSSQACWR
ncbi:hypothetical protein BKA67DRAFT_534855 [Truncatella angustata]|uniref:Uncharacterized protein n=1 Tax=Truncatella angustata TaxID=152316 RepID=A0A9P8UPN5_9PEZI|nr:uncharacterized protein BKA67DRAFT_534855 [Truncatella angustata]KAH6655948.1 hypothetical protein BKA67DRAFT_534855 [Truncatella angustata]